MIKEKNIFLNSVFNSCLCFGLAGGLFLSNVYAQKSSGVLDSEQVENFSQSVPNISDSVTQNAAAVGDAVRFLLRPIREADISPSMTGTVERIHFNIGQRFKKGDVLISMKCASIDAQVAAQRARVKQYSLDNQADQEMFESNAVSHFTAKKSKASLDEQNALLRDSLVSQKNCKVIAPFSGGVISKDVHAFEAVTPSVIVMSIIDDSGLVMSLNVPSSFVNRIQPNDTFTVTVDETNKTYAAKVVGVSPAIDPVSKTIELRAAVTEGLDELVAGMSGRANMDFTR